MAESGEGEFEDDLTLRSRFVRGRNTLFARGDFSALFVDFYLHLKDNDLQLSQESAERMKRALALFGLHCISRPRNESLAWTINFQDPLVNVFVAGDTSTGEVTGRIYTEGVKRAKENAFYQDSLRRGRDPHRSVVGFSGSDMIGAVEEFYAMSEQRPARFFELAPEEFAILAAHPDYDEDWFASLSHEDVLSLDATEELVDLESRPLRWHCGCNQRKIMKVLLETFIAEPDELFLGEELVEVNCPRCASKHRISREMMEAFLADHASPGAGGVDRS